MPVVDDVRVDIGRVNSCLPSSSCLSAFSSSPPAPSLVRVPFGCSAVLFLFFPLGFVIGSVETALDDGMDEEDGGGTAAERLEAVAAAEAMAAAINAAPVVDIAAAGCHSHTNNIDQHVILLVNTNAPSSSNAE